MDVPHSQELFAVLRALTYNARSGTFSSDRISFFALRAKNEIQI
jgi:hypothetical protein